MDFSSFSHDWLVIWKNKIPFLIYPAIGFSMGAVLGFYLFTVKFLMEKKLSNKKIKKIFINFLIVIFLLLSLLSIIIIGTLLRAIDEANGLGMIAMAITFFGTVYLVDSINKEFFKNNPRS